MEALKEFDADPNVIVIIAHDPTSLEVFDFFPKGTVTEWQKKGLKKRHHWGFLNEMPYNGKTVRPTITDGLYEGTKQVRGLELPA